MSLLYTGQVTDKQSRVERLFILTILAITLVTATWVWGNDKGEPAMHEAPMTCEAEDEVIVRLEEDAYDLAAGAMFCVHIDTIRGDNDG